MKIIKNISFSKENVIEINKIYQGNCLDIMKTFPNNCIDLVVTSPPYDNLRYYNGYEFEFENIAKELFRIIKVGGVCVWIVNDSVVNGSESGNSFRQALYFKDDIGFNLHDTMIYEKLSTRYPEKYRYGQAFEYMFILTKGLPKTCNILKEKRNKCNMRIKTITNRQKDGSMKKKVYDSNSQYKNRTNIWLYDPGYMKSTKDDIAYEHPAIFPEELAQDHILSWSNDNDIVLDPFAGSGTTLKMALLNNRKYIGIEISKEYIDIANERINNADKQIRI